jgi:hypothetical protein
MKKKACIFTIVKDEDYFLPIWMNYYSQYFDKSDIYILDHNTIGNSTKNLNVNVIKIDYSELFNHSWLVSTVKEYQLKLFEKYEIVVFTEIDEILYSTLNPFDKIIDEFYESDMNYISCIGYEIMQDLQKEVSIKVGDSIAKKRKYWYRMESYDKTLISKIPLDWQIGFHFVNGVSPNFLSEFYMAHLHYVDAEQAYIRYQSRLKGGTINTNMIPSEFWKSMENRDNFYNRFPNPEHKKHPIEIMSETHTNALIRYGL